MATRPKSSASRGRAKAAVDPRDHVIDAFMELLAGTDYGAIALADVAAEAGVSLSEIRGLFSGKVAMMEAFSRRIDQMVLNGPAAEGDSARDRLFDVIMRRLDALASHKPALTRLAGSARRDPGLAARIAKMNFGSQRWMFAAAGVGHGGLRGTIALSGVALLMGETTRVWLKDDDPGLARTMASLDKGLERGGRLMRLVDDLCRMSCDLRAGRSQRTQTN